MPIWRAEHKGKRAGYHPEELERAGAHTIREYKRSELIRKLLLYGSAAMLFGLGILTEYGLKHP